MKFLDSTELPTAAETSGASPAAAAAAETTGASPEAETTGDMCFIDGRDESDLISNEASHGAN